MSADALLAALAGACLALAAAPLALRVAAAAGALAHRPRWPGPGRRIRSPAAVAMPTDLPARVAAAGAPRGWAGADWARLTWGLAFAGGCCAALVLAGGPGRAGVTLALGLPVAGFLAPDAARARRAARRRAAIAAEAPDLLDRLRLAVESGMAPDRAVARAAAHGRGPLARELRAMTGAVALGQASGEALDELRRRCAAPEADALAALLGRSLRHGAPLAVPLRALADGLRAERARRRRERAATSAPKIQLVVALLLVPAALLVVAAGMLAQSPT